MPYLEKQHLQTWPPNGNYIVPAPCLKWSVGIIYIYAHVHWISGMYLWWFWTVFDQYICTYLQTYECMKADMHESVCMYVCMYAFLYLCMMLPFWGYILIWQQIMPTTGSREAGVYRQMSISSHAMPRTINTTTSKCVILQAQLIHQLS